MADKTLQDKMIRLLHTACSARAGDCLDITSLHRKTADLATEELQDSIVLLDSLSLAVEYLVFDLEATRRENMYLRKVIHDSETEADR